MLAGRWRRTRGFVFIPRVAGAETSWWGGATTERTFCQATVLLDTCFPAPSSGNMLESRSRVDIDTSGLDFLRDDSLPESLIVGACLS